VSSDTATVTVFVAVPQPVAFQVFTNEIDLWWLHGPRYRIGGRAAGRLWFEQGLGGGLFETFGADPGSRTFRTGRITEWDPPKGLSFDWTGVNYKPDEKTHVAVLFEPAPGGCRVTLRHSGWATLPGDHPARHGLEGAAFLRMIGLWWGDLLTSFREHNARKA
jgi:hypothetical protein